MPPHLLCDVAADYAGDRASRESTSGGHIFGGKQLLNSWASNQAVIALSSGESVLYGLVKGYSCSLGCQSMCEDFGVEVPIVVGTDSSEAKSLCGRMGFRQI